MNLTNNGHGSYQTLKNQYFANLVNGLMPFFFISSKYSILASIYSSYQAEFTFSKYSAFILT